MRPRTPWTILTATVTLAIIPIQTTVGIEHWPEFYLSLGAAASFLAAGSFILRDNAVRWSSALIVSLWLFLAIAAFVQASAHGKSHYTYDEPVIVRDLLLAWAFVPMMLISIIAASIRSRVCRRYVRQSQFLEVPVYPAGNYARSYLPS